MDNRAETNRRYPQDGFIGPLELGFAVGFGLTVGPSLAISTYQVGAERALELQHTLSARMRAQHMPDPGAIVSVGTDHIHQITGSAEAAVASFFILTALLTADLVRRTRRSILRRLN